MSKLRFGTSIKARFTDPDRDDDDIPNDIHYDNHHDIFDDENTLAVHLETLLEILTDSEQYRTHMACISHPGLQSEYAGGEDLGGTRVAG